MKKKLVITISAVCLFAVIIGGSIYAASNWDFSEWGQASNKAVQDQKYLSDDADYVAVVNGEKINQSSFESYKAGLAQTGNDFTDQEIIDKLVQRKIVMQEAKKRGFTATDEEIEAFVDETMQLISDDPEIAEIVNRFIQDAGITMEDYKNRCRITGRETVLSNKLRDDIHTQFENTNNANSLSDEGAQSFDEYFKAYLNELYESAEVE